MYFAYVVTKNKELLNIYQESEKGDVKVCRALDEMFEESINKGIQMGIKQGIERGIEQGIEQGITTSARRMLSSGKYSDSEISEITGLSVEQIQALKNSAK